jgi:hypothetical protein
VLHSREQLFVCLCLEKATRGGNGNRQTIAEMMRWSFSRDTVIYISNKAKGRLAAEPGMGSL